MTALMFSNTRRRFLLEVAFHHLHGDRIERDLARHVHRVADANGLRIGPMAFGA